MTFRAPTFFLLAMLAGYTGGTLAQSYPGPMPAPPPPPGPTPSPTASTFTATALVSNGAVRAATTDPTLVNPWGIALGPDTPMWVANNATQTATVYDGAGVKQPVMAALPSGANGPANPTGVVFNNTP